MREYGNVVTQIMLKIEIKNAIRKLDNPVQWEDIVAAVEADEGDIDRALQELQCESEVRYGVSPAAGYLVTEKPDAAEA